MYLRVLILILAILSFSDCSVYMPALEEKDNELDECPEVSRDLEDGKWVIDVAESTVKFIPEYFTNGVGTLSGYIVREGFPIALITGWYTCKRSIVFSAAWHKYDHDFTASWIGRISEDGDELLTQSLHNREDQDAFFEEFKESKRIFGALIPKNM